MELKKQVPFLVDLCIQTAIDNVRYLGDVGETDTDFLEQILPHCTVDQLMHIEKNTQGRDLSPVTDKLWKKFYEKQFGPESASLVLKRMNQKKVAFRWMQLYKAKLKDVEDAQNKSVDRMRQLYKSIDARRQSRQVQICSKVPPGTKRSFWGNGPGYNVSNVKSNIMKKAKIEFLKSQEVKNIAAIKKNAIQRTPCAPRVMGPPPKSFASTSKQVKPPQRRF